MVIGSSEKCSVTSVMVKDEAGVLKHDSTLSPFSKVNGESILG